MASAGFPERDSHGSRRFKDAAERWFQRKGRPSAWRTALPLFLAESLGRDGGLHLLRRNRVTAGEGLGAVTGELDHGLGETRGLADEAVELRAGELALQAEEVGRRLHLGEGLEGGGSLLEALAAILGHFLADLLDALGDDLGGGDERLDIAAAELGQLF